eukprot:3384468-Amphidinium_carterae.1
MRNSTVREVTPHVLVTNPTLEATLVRQRGWPSDCLKCKMRCSGQCCQPHNSSPKVCSLRSLAYFSSLPSPLPVVLGLLHADYLNRFAQGHAAY